VVAVVEVMDEDNGDPGDVAEERRLWAREGASPSDVGRTVPP
jgi:hypothetical protein